MVNKIKSFTMEYTMIENNFKKNEFLRTLQSIILQIKLTLSIPAFKNRNFFVYF